MRTLRITPLAGHARHKAPRARGFTILELVVVIAVTGVIATVVSVNWQSNAAYTVGTQAERLASRLRHVQSLASNWQLRLRVTPNANGYVVTCVEFTGSAPCVASGDTVHDPASGQLLSVTLDDGVTLSASALDFDAWGRPTSTAGTLITTAGNFALAGGGKNFTVSVAPVTGHVSVSP